ncbi:MAG: outer membrane beta-barrel protein [Bdellovibrionaceae bacterium]|nr:outer membrane beta-barrel protein [Pseudobdellovibrionaceae bacterium]
MKRILFIILLSLSIVIFSAEDVFARGGGGSGGHALSFGLTTVSSDQKDINSIIDHVNATQGGVSTKTLTSAYDFFAQYTYRFSGSIFALAFRPSLFMQSGKGSGATVGDYSHSLTGYTFFPLLRIYPLENSFIRFYMQGGVGFGYLKGEVKQGESSVSYAGSNFGAQAGLGAEFCFTDNHCMSLEGNLRYLPIERNIADSVSGTPTGFTQVQNSREVEYDQNDMATTMSGIQGVLAYTYNF